VGINRAIVSDLDPDWILIPSGHKIRIWVREGKIDTQKLRKFMFLSARCSLSRAEGFSFNLNILYGCLGEG
jgi:hypothetical protein